MNDDVKWAHTGRVLGLLEKVASLFPTSDRVVAVRSCRPGAVPRMFFTVRGTQGLPQLAEEIVLAARELAKNAPEHDVVVSAPPLQEEVLYHAPTRDVPTRGDQKPANLSAVPGSPKPLEAAVRAQLRALVDAEELDLGTIGRFCTYADDMLVWLGNPKDALIKKHKNGSGEPLVAQPPWGSNPGYDAPLPGMASPFTLPGQSSETFGANVLKQLIPALSNAAKQGETPLQLVEALAAARKAGLSDVTAELEKKLGLVKSTNTVSPVIVQAPQKALEPPSGTIEASTGIAASGSSSQALSSEQDAPGFPKLLDKFLWDARAAACGKVTLWKVSKDNVVEQPVLAFPFPLLADHEADQADHCRLLREVSLYAEKMLARLPPGERVYLTAPRSNLEPLYWPEAARGEGWATSPLEG